MAASVVQWICCELSRLLQVDTTEDVAQYILSMEDANELRDYMHELLDVSDPRHKRFIDELLQRWRPPARPVAVPDNAQVYRKIDEDQTYIQGHERQKNKKKNKQKALNMDEGSQPVKQEAPGLETSPSSDLKKKHKFVPLFSKEGREVSAVRLPGRHVCECQAVKHSLINNCVRCGRIVCDQEGSGPCLFCGNLVCTKEEQEILDRGSKKSDKLLQQLMQQGGDAGSMMLPNKSSQMQTALDKAIQHKNKLLHYDKTSVKRTQVIDDESDYFSTGSQWMSKEERKKLDSREEELRSKRFASRKDRKITLDFAGRQVLDEEEVVNVYDQDDSVVKAVQYGETRPHHKAFDNSDFTSLVNPHISSAPPKFVDTPLSCKPPSINMNFTEAIKKKKSVRIQDREFQEMSDEGMCMSMHQPYATLLVAGIKMHEGRTWYTPHRGRLWIAAAAMQPSVEETAEIEKFYRMRGMDDFPDEYPISCLLGCVDVVDCLPQDEYRKKFPEGESSSPYVFICQNPQELVVKFSMKGKHKIYKLESHVHQAAKKGLMYAHED